MSNLQTGRSDGANEYDYALIYIYDTIIYGNELRLISSPTSPASIHSPHRRY